MSQYQNVFDKNPVPGMELFNQLLRNEISCRQAAKEFNKHNIKATERNIQVIMKRIRDKSNKPKQPETQTIINQSPKQSPNDVMALISKKYANTDLSDIPDIDPIKLMDKHLHELEMVLIQYDDPAVKYKIIELEMKIAERLFKMRPTNTEINVNELLRKNDLSVEFIIKMNGKYPDLKQSWLDFINQDRLESK